MRTSFLLMVSVGLLIGSLALPAQAGLLVTRDATVTDDSGGSLVFATSASHEAEGSNSLTSATFSDFQPKADGAVIDGDVVRTRIRNASEMESTFDGSLQIVPGQGGAAAAERDQPGQLDLTLQGVTIARAGGGPQLSGTVIVNGETFDAAELPRPIARAVHWVLRFFHFA